MMNEEHCDRNSLVSVATDHAMALPMALRASPMGQNHVNIQKVDKMVGKNFILVLLTTLVCVVIPKHHFIRP